MFLYQKESKSPSDTFNKSQNQIWVYHLESGKHVKIYDDGYNPKWSPKENIIAFQINGVLNISNLKTFYNIALGVDSYEWQPDGKGFVASSSVPLLPTGWTKQAIYTISIADGYQNINNLTENVKVRLSSLMN